MLGPPPPPPPPTTWGPSNRPIPGAPPTPAPPAPALIVLPEMNTSSLLSSSIAIELPPEAAAALRIVRPSRVSALAAVPVTAVVPPSTTVALAATSRRNVVGLYPPYTLTLECSVRLPEYVPAAA